MNVTVYDVERQESLGIADDLDNAPEPDINHANTIRNHANAEFDRLGAVLSAHDIELRDVVDIPNDLGLENLSFINHAPLTQLEVERMLEATNPAVPYVRTKPLTEENLDTDDPLILKHHNRQQGVDKFLLDDEYQKERVADFIENSSDSVLACWGLQRYIMSPIPDRAASYRVIVTPTGDIIGAGLIHAPIPEQVDIHAPDFPADAIIEKSPATYLVRVCQSKRGVLFTVERIQIKHLSRRRKHTAARSRGDSFRLRSY